MTLHRRSLLAAAGALGPAATFLGTGARAADAYPNHALRWIVAYPAAGGSDFLARQLAPQMGKQMGQTIVVDNRPGAAGIIGTEAASKQPGDGYTLLTGDNGAMVFHTALYKSLPYNPTDFVPMGFMASFPLILVANPAAGFNGAAQFLEAVKRNPGKYSYASPGAGSPHHLAMELLEAAHRQLHRARALPRHRARDAGRAQRPGADHGGRHRRRPGADQERQAEGAGRAVEAPHRAAARRPTRAEVGGNGPLKDFEAMAWQGLFAPKGTPPDIAERLTAEMRRRS